MPIDPCASVKCGNGTVCKTCKTDADCEGDQKCCENNNNSDLQEGSVLLSLAKCVPIDCSVTQ
jgi:hypothetical protein